ncbi:MAG: hypothetical protein ABIJ57_04220 [Pseudomonadota bacterium]
MEQVFSWNELFGPEIKKALLTVRGFDKARYDVYLIRGLSQESRMSRQNAVGAMR